MQPGMPSAAFPARMPCWLLVSFVSTGTSRFFPAKLFLSWLPPASAGAWGCSATATELAFPAAELHKIPVGLFLQLVESPESPGLSIPPPGFVSSAY